MSDSRLEYYETEWKREKARREQLERMLEESGDTLLQERQRISQLQQELQAIKGELETNQRKAEIAQAAQEGLRQRLEALQKTQSDLMLRMNNERFWRKDFLLPLAEEMAALDEALQVVEASPDWQAQFAIWHKEILSGLERLLDGTDDGTMAEQIRRRVLAQWVYLRWLEIFNLFRERP